MIYILVYDRKFIMVETYWILRYTLTMYCNFLIILRPVKIYSLSKAEPKQFATKKLVMFGHAGAISYIIFSISVSFIISFLFIMGTCYRHIFGFYNTGLVCGFS